MAHNYYRIPMRIRFRALHELNPNEGEVLSRSKCRRHRRKLRFLLNLYELRQKKHGTWMETHVWHAKRFHMGERWGVKYPTRCSDKSDRSTYRLVQRNSACVMDRSYYTSFEIVFGDNANAILPLLQRLKLKPAPLPFFRTIDLHSSSVDQALIAPVDLLHLADRLIVTVHPSAA